MANHDNMQRPSGTPGTPLAWFEVLRLAVPEPVPDYYHRPALVEKLMPIDHRVAVLYAPGGFGKTVLLAECCRALVERGITTAWLRADENDDHAAFERYLGLAIARGGVEFRNPPGSDAWNAADDRIGLILGAVEANGTPCVVAIDEVEQLTDVGVAGLNTLLRRAPPNLHVAIAGRELPHSLDIAEPVLAGQGFILSVDELRFSKPEIAGFFDLRLSRAELAEVSRESMGWPIALRLYRNEMGSDTQGEAQGFRDVLGNWLEARLWRRLPGEDRELLLDIGLFDRVDPVLLDEVLETSDSKQRLLGMRELEGLIDPPPDRAAAGQLHPLIREYCAKRRLRETPARHRSLHRRIALALDRRGETISATRHAVESGDTDLVGRILENAGGIRYWGSRGILRLLDAEPFLSREVTEKRPRLALVRCVLLVLGDRFAEARREFDFAANRTEGFTRNPTGDDRDVRIDHRLTQGLLAFLGCRPIDMAEAQTVAADLLEFSQDEGLDPTTRGVLEYALCIYENLQARFDAAAERAERCLQFVSGGRSPYLSMQIDIQLGSIAMAQGQVEDAEAWYIKGRKTAKTLYSEDTTPILPADVYLRELELERNRLAHAVGMSLRTRDTFARPGNSFSMYAAESAIVAELTQQAVGVDMALSGLSEMWEYARRTDRPTLVRYLSALRVSMLAAAGRADQAERAWRTEGLPKDEDGCLTLLAQGWREMEAIASARLRLFIARGEFEPGRQFAQRLLETAEAHNLVRTTMRCLAISMGLEYSSGDTRMACTHLTAFLRRYAHTDYARPIVREGDAGREALTRVLETNPATDIRTAADDLLHVLGGTEQKEAAIAGFSDRELVVLKQLENRRDKQIATDLGISLDGVRYHVRKIFAKLGARGRHDAVHRARAIGLLPREE